MTSRQDTSDNPFADPAAVLETGRTPNHQPDPATIETSALSEYNPFGTDYHSLDGQISSHPGLPPPYSAFEAQRATEELERRQKMLDAKAAELAQREEQYRLAAQSRLAESGELVFLLLTHIIPCWDIALLVAA
ncbi:unnamed protein product [Dicrocoelium dendriticum]|nr:unnamed protein product [Dicrocoelium dendriticum]